MELLGAIIYVMEKIKKIKKSQKDRYSNKSRIGGWLKKRHNEWGGAGHLVTYQPVQTQKIQQI